MHSILTTKCLICCINCVQEQVLTCAVMTCILNNIHGNSGVSAETSATALCNGEVGNSQYLVSEAVVSKEGPLAPLTSDLLVPSA